MRRSLGSRTAIAFAAFVVATSVIVVAATPAGAAPSWSIAPSPSAPDGTGLTAVSCPTTADCFAVGGYQTGSAVQSWIGRWNGSAWSRMISPSPPSATAVYLRALTCLSTTSCFAVGGYNSPKEKTLVMRWNGSVWSIMTSPNPAFVSNPELEGVGCRGATNCFAVGRFQTNQSGSTLRSLIEHWDGSAWSIMTHPRPTGVSVLNAVRCPGATSCFSIGGYGTGNGNNTLVEHWDGSTWSIMSSPTPTGATFAGLNSLSCTSLTNCFAVGQSAGTGNGYRTLVEHWDGSAWSTITSPNVLSASNGLFSVACPSAANCFAVGFTQYNPSGLVHSLIEHWDGSAWSIVTHPRPSGSSWLFSVSCPSGLECFAVGYYETTAGTPAKPLVEAYR
ncbi:MAG: hypothetical protein QOG50_3575 [Actinomycetota bacterium]|jgi:hypothetical protein|nr:hypothetical protein [Actinomycetota bacterium]